VAHDLEALLGKGIVAAHHGARAKRTRLPVEKKLQNGSCARWWRRRRSLGIDIGTSSWSVSSAAAIDRGLG
jgi:Lhr-like helicase